MPRKSKADGGEDRPDMGQLHVYDVPVWVLEAATAVARSTHRTRSAWVRHILEREVRAAGHAPPEGE